MQVYSAQICSRGDKLGKKKNKTKNITREKNDEVNITVVIS